MAWNTPNTEIQPCFYCGEMPEHHRRDVTGPWSRVSPNAFRLTCATPGCAGQTTREYLFMGRTIANWNNNVYAKRRIVKNAINTAPPLWRAAI